MKRYPSIPTRGRFGNDLYVYAKLDGSNIRADWRKGKGFVRFGRRNGLLDDSNPWLLEAPDLILKNGGDFLDRELHGAGFTRVTAFFEFWGENSFAGGHIQEPHRCDLIDVSVHRKGILTPEVYEEMFGNFDYRAPLLGRGFTLEDLKAVKGGTYPGMPLEGVVVKGPLNTPGLPCMQKIKSDAWIAKLREMCGSNECMFGKLL